MLVCSVSLRPPRAAISAGLVETATALDAAAVSAVFASLIDEPAFAADSANAILGSLMVEAASASDSVSSGGTYAAAIIEAAAAADVAATAAGTISADVAEAATAASTQDGSVTSAIAARSAMVPGVFINTGTSLEANANGVMINQ